MYQRRSTKLRPAQTPLTPDLPQAPIELNHDELIAQNNYLRHITSAERRRHAAVEKQFVKALDELQTTLDNVRVLYIAQVAPKPQPSEGRS
jgi:hypothetical protein